MAKKGKGNSSFNQGAMNASYDKTIADMQKWNDFAYSNAGGAIDYAQENPYQQAATPYVQSMLGGSMSTNPWMQNLYGNVSHVNMNESMDMLRDFLGYSNQGNATPGRTPAPTGKGRPTSQGGGRSLGAFGGSEDRGNAGGYHGSSHSGGLNPGGIPDSTAGEGVWSENINDFLDDSALDPENDPTLQPMIDAIQRESEESYWASMQDLNAQLEGAGQFGSGLYQAMMTGRNEEYNEALQGTLATQYQAARQAALQHKMEALNMINQRDIASAQIAAQESAAAGAASAQADAIAAQMQMHNQEMQLQGIGMMMQGSQFGLGLQGDMASLMQQGQLGALSAGAGYGQLGMMGYGAATNFGGLGLQALGGIGSLNESRYNTQLLNQQFNQNMAWQQQQYNDQAPFNYLNGLINSMRGLSDLSGANVQAPYMPSSPGAAPGGFGGADVLGGILTGLGNYQKAGGTF